MKNTPKVGQTVLVTHVTDGNGQISRCKENVAYISAVYLDGTIRIGYGDVYEIEKNDGGKAIWKTKVPRRQRDKVAA